MKINQNHMMSGMLHVLLNWSLFTLNQMLRSITPKEKLSLHKILLLWMLSLSEVFQDANDYVQLMASSSPPERV